MSFAVAVLAGALSVGHARPCHAQASAGAGSSTSTPAFEAANAAWEKGAFPEASLGYEKAIDAGGLGPIEVVIAYTRVGIARAAAGKRDLALSAFRTASTIDPAFELPPDASPRARPLYEQACKEAATRARLAVKVAAPDRVADGRVFTLKTEVADEAAAYIDKVEVDVFDTLSKRTCQTGSQAVAEALTFEIAGKCATGGSTLVVQVRLLDSKGNRWVTQDVRVTVAASEVEKRPAGPGDESAPKKPTTFFGGPWPYVIGGGLLLAGGVSTFLLVRGNDKANVGAPAWSER
jgi:hypothetical protein